MNKEKSPRILFVEDLPSDMELALRELRKGGIEFTSLRVETGKEFQKAMNEFKPDIVISDYFLPSFDGMQALKLSKAHDSIIPFIVLTGSMNEETAVECMKAGADDYVIKEHLSRIPFAVREAIEQKKIRLKKEEAEQALRESEEQFRTLFETATEGICVADINEKIILVNPRMAEMTGYSVDELMNMNCKQLVFPDGLDNFLAKMEDRKKGISHSYESRLLKKDGSTIWGLVSASPLLDKEGNYRGSFGMFTDITEHKKSNQKILQLSRAVEQSPASVIITNQNGEIEYVNQKLCELTGYTNEELIGKNPSIWKSEHHDKKFYEELWNTILEGKNWQGEILNKKKNGELYWEFALISPLLNNEGDITHFLAVNEDITEKKKIFEELIAAKEKAEEMNKIKSYFFANVSHELRTPFVGIQGFAELLAEKLTDPGDLEMVNTIINSSKRLTDTLNDILSLSKLEFERTEVQKSDVNVSDLLNDCHKSLVSLTIQKDLSFTLVENDQPLIIKSDEKLLRGIINNLIRNAIKFTQKGKIEVRSLITKRGEAEYLRINVSDTGIGIPKDRQDQIWIAFRQGSEGLNRTFEGTGLGLTITKKYVELLGGTISLDSELGKGSTFIVELPIERADIQQFVEKQSSGITEKRIIKAKIVSKKLLYVEDDEYSTEVIKKVLSKQYEIETVKNAETVLEKVKMEKYDALLIDINLGHGMDGIQLMEKIREFADYQKTPMIAVTAYASESDRDEFLSRGFTHYISKPFSLKDLLKLVNGVFVKA